MHAASVKQDLHSGIPSQPVRPSACWINPRIVCEIGDRVGASAEPNHDAGHHSNGHDERQRNGSPEKGLEHVCYLLGRQGIARADDRRMTLRQGRSCDALALLRSLSLDGSNGGDEGETILWTRIVRT